MYKFLVVAALLFSNHLFSQEKIKGYENNWPQWRGPEVTGAAIKGNPPVEWSETKNVKWKIAIPGKGHSTPIVWGEKMFITSAVETEKTVVNDTTVKAEPAGRMASQKTDKIHKFVVLCIDRRNGKVMWERTVTEELPLEATHALGSWASNSAVTDGENLFAFFGSHWPSSRCIARLSLL